jgi:hypothetical protein
MPRENCFVFNKTHTMKKTSFGNYYRSIMTTGTGDLREEGGEDGGGGEE